MKRAWLLLWLLLPLAVTAAGEPGCDCDPALIHLCRCKVLITTPVARKQMAYIQRVLARQFDGRLSLGHPIEVEVSPADQLKTVVGEHLQGLYDDGKVWVSDSLIREEAMMVLAHEYGHAWHFEHHPDPDHISDQLAEGFAEWVAFHALAPAGFTDFCDRIKRSPDPIYGGGFRFYHGVEQQFGPEAVFNIAQTWLDMDGRKVDG